LRWPNEETAENLERRSLLHLWEKVDWREAPRRMMGVGRITALQIGRCQGELSRETPTASLRPAPLIRRLFPDLASANSEGDTFSHKGRR